jgi:hypothetical protein
MQARRWLAGRPIIFLQQLPKATNVFWAMASCGSIDVRPVPGHQHGHEHEHDLKGQPPRPTAASAILVASQFTAYSNTKPF